jgi:hypothetical protein
VVVTDRLLGGLDAVLEVMTVTAIAGAGGGGPALMPQHQLSDLGYFQHRDLVSRLLFWLASCKV